jgi:chromosome partitioning protein
MTTVITITNQKGGIGKSTTAQALGAGYSLLKGKKVLLIDLDAQENLTLATGAKRGVGNVYNLLRQEKSLEEVIQHLNDRLDIIPATAQLSRADIDLNETGKEYRLKEAIAPVLDKYDYVIIDTPPALGVLTVNALTIADKVIIPAQADLFSLEAIKQLYRTITGVKSYTNPKIEIAGILLTRYNPRTVLTKELTDLISNTAKTIQAKVFSRPIREAVAIKEAQATHTDIFSYAPNSKVAGDYKALIEELN